MSSFASLPTLATFAPPCIAAVALAWAAVTDVQRYIIPNTASVIVVIAYLASAVVSAPPAVIIGNVVIAGASLILGGFLFATGRMGGGDVKLFASLSLWAGYPLMAPFALVTCASAFVLSLLMLSPLSALMPAASPSAIAMTGSDKGARRPMPFGVAIVLGGFYLMARHLADGR